MITTLLIANRGEIACRIIRTARKMGLSTVAVYSTADINSPHVKQADRAFCLGAPAASESYLNIEAIIAVAKESGANAIHPGYGFLSENVKFAQACEEANIIFVGPSVPAMEAMSSKQLAKQRLEQTNVPLTPGYHGMDQSDERLLREAKHIGFPLLLKAACGGGGKGMRAVFTENDFHNALSSARRESQASFADDTMILEALIQEPRHIEMQIMADNHGIVVHLYERDCSIQRRHQKVIEEAPASHLSLTCRKKLAEAAIEVAKTIQYRGAGTVEFIMDKDGTFYFMEMNTRLQVEHPVTEMITGLDLVEWQLRIAANEPLPLSQEQIKIHGHAIECRVCAEDPEHDFMPSIGQITFLQEPHTEHVRIDTGITQHSVISRYYDSMIAKCITWGEDREQARMRLQQALTSYCVGGVKTNLPLLQAILAHPRFKHNQLSTAFLTEETLSLPTPSPVLMSQAAACMDYWTCATHADALYQDTFAWQPHLSRIWIKTYQWQQEQIEIRITPISPKSATLAILSPESMRTSDTTFHIEYENNKLYLHDGHQQHQLNIQQHQDESWTIYTSEGSITFTTNDSQSLSQSPHLGHQLTAPMPGTIVTLFKKKGDTIKAGEPLLVLEAMKMEHTIRAPRDGVISEVFYDIGTQVNEGSMLVALEDE